ncbi:unnamed protein product [Closterium sp. NIES-54]
MVRPAAAIVTMVDPVANAGVADTLEARLADARKRLADGEYGTIPLLIVELGIRSLPVPFPLDRCETKVASTTRSTVVHESTATMARSREEYSRSTVASTRVRRKCSTRRRLHAARVLTTMVDVALLYKAVEGSRRRRMESIEPQLEVAGLKGFTDGTVPIPPVDDVGLRGEFRAAHLLTFMVISSDGSLTTKMAHIRMGEQESATDYCNRDRWILAEMRMAGAEYSTASYISHIAKGLPRGYNLMKRMMMVPDTRESLENDSITSYILQDEAMQEAEQPTELLPQANYAAPTKLNQQQGQRRKQGGGGSGSGRLTKDVDEKRSTRDKGRGGGGRRRECWICHDPDHLSYECPDRDDNDKDDTKGGRSRSTSCRPRRDAKPCKEKQASKKTSSTKDVDHSNGKSRGGGEASCSMVGVVEPTWLLPPPDGTKAVFVDMAPSDNVKHMRGFNGALQPVEGRGAVALQGEAGKRVLIPNVLYVPGVHSNLLCAGQLKESGVQMQGDGVKLLLVAPTGEVLGRARYNAWVICTDLRPCSTRSSSTEVVALRTIASATKSTSDWLHERLAHVDVDTTKSSAKHDVATGLNIKPSTREDPPCVSCIGGKLARHTFPDKGSDAEEALAVVHIDLCGPFRVAAKDGSLYFLVLKDRHTQFVWVMPVAKKSDVLREFHKWLQNGMVEREMRTVVESVRTMLLHMGVHHHWTTPYQLLIGKKPDLTLARVWGCMVHFMVLEQQHGGKLAPKACWGLHLGVSPESKGWEVLDPTDNTVVTSVKVIFYETPSLEVWKAKCGPASGWTRAHPPTDTSTVTVPLLAEVDEPTDEDVVEVLPPSPILAPPLPVADRPASTPVSATGDEGSLEASPVAPARGIASGRQGAKLVDQDGELVEQEAAEGVPVEQEAVAGVQLTGELLKSAEDLAVDKEEELSAGEESTNSDVVEVDDDLLCDNAKEDKELPELDPDVHADPEHRWDIATMTVKEAMASWKGEAVKAAMEEEIRSLIGMGTWELVERPRGVNIMKNRWVCGADYDEMYSPVSSYVTLRIFLSIVAVLDLNLMQLNMKNAFLQSKLDRVLYMYQPDYFDDGTGWVCKLLKTLYGLKQSPLLWYRALDGVLLGAGWKKSQVDEAFYFKAGDNGMTYWVLVYVDDLLAASSSPAMLKKLKELLEDSFELREISPVVKYLGLEIVRDKPSRKLWLHQQGYADKLHRRFINEEQGSPKDTATSTRPDIAFACSKLGSGLTVRSDQHWREVDRCLAYLADTRDTTLLFGGGPESLELIGYVDADDAGNKHNRTSTGGYMFIYGGDAVSWSSSRIKCMTLSSSESEYGCRQGGTPTSFPSCGIQATRRWEADHPARQQQHMVRHGNFALKYIPTTEQPADFLTKALHSPAFNRCSVAIGQVRLADIGDGNDDAQQ